MTVDAVLGVDLGTTTAKTVIVDGDGAVLAADASDPIPIVNPEPGAAEQEHRALKTALDDSIARALADGPDGTRIVAMAVAAQSGSVAPIDENDDPAGNLITWMDARATSEVDALSVEDRDLIRSITGWTASAGLGMASIGWLRSAHPETFARAVRWASVDDFAGWALTGAWRTNPSNAAGMQLMDVTRLEWDGGLCEHIGVAPSQLSPIRPSGETLGLVSDHAARSSTLAPETPVIVGGHDQTCAALALGATSPGDVMVSLGTAWVLTAVTDRVDLHRLPTDLNLSPHVVSGAWTASQNLGGLGAVLDWWRREAHGPEADPRRLEADLTEADPRGPFFVPDLTGRADGRWGRFVGEEPRHGLAERTRAVVESAVFEVQRALRTIAATVTRPSGLTLVGGGSRSVGLRQMLAEVTGLPVVIPNDASWPALGAADIAASSLGWTQPVAPIGSSNVVEPAEAASAVHDERYETYLRLVKGEST